MMVEAAIPPGTFSLCMPVMAQIRVAGLAITMFLKRAMTFSLLFKILNPIFAHGARVAKETRGSFIAMTFKPMTAVSAFSCPNR